MAGDAFEIGVPEACRLVAGFTRFDGVEAEERKRGELVVETDVFPPALFIVTLSAVLSLSARVGIIAPVTVDASSRNFYAVWVAGMAVLTGDFGVASE